LFFLAVFVSFEVYFTAENVRGFMLLMKLKLLVFWDVTPHHCASGPRHFKGTCRIHLQEFKVQA
jgi:hypothetical protein